MDAFDFCRYYYYYWAAAAATTRLLLGPIINILFYFLGGSKELIQPSDSSSYVTVFCLHKQS